MDPVTKLLTAGLLFAIPLAITLWAPVIGLCLSAALLWLLAAFTFGAGPSQTKEVAAAVLLVGGFLCAGLAGLVQSLTGVRTVGRAMAKEIRDREALDEIAAVQAERQARNAERLE